MQGGDSLTRISYGCYIRGLKGAGVCCQPKDLRPSFLGNSFSEEKKKKTTFVIFPTKPNLSNIISSSRTAANSVKIYFLKNRKYFCGEPRPLVPEPDNGGGQRSEPHI